MPIGRNDLRYHTTRELRTLIIVRYAMRVCSTSMYYTFAFRGQLKEPGQ